MIELIRHTDKNITIIIQTPKKSELYLNGDTQLRPNEIDMYLCNYHINLLRSGRIGKRKKHVEHITLSPYSFKAAQSHSKKLDMWAEQQYEKFGKAESSISQIFWNVK